MIYPERWYSLTDLTDLAKIGVTPYKSRQTWLELIKKGEITALEKGEGKKIVYMLQGKDIINHLNARKIHSNQK